MPHDCIVHRGGALFWMYLLFLLIGTASGWHAFVDQEATPDYEETALRSGLALPRLSKVAGENGLDDCSMAATSFQRAMMVCGSGTTCSLNCALAWNSAMRDAQGAIDISCQALEAVVNSTFFFSASVTPPWTLEEWLVLQLRCRTRCGSVEEFQACTVDPQYRLEPPSTVCPGFRATNGFYQYRVLTWQTMKYYQDQGLGCAGGLSVLADFEHSTWACVYEDSCPALEQADDLACFKYSHMRGEFHFWDLNSALHIVPPLFQVDAAFCDGSGRMAIRNARDGNVIDILSLHYKLTRYYPEGVEKETVQGMARDLGDWGCGTFQLRKNAKYWLELQAPGYYTWTGWFYTPDDHVVISGALYPLLEDECGIGITLSWCPEAARNLDLYIFRPDNSTGLIGS